MTTKEEYEEDLKIIAERKAYLKKVQSACRKQDMSYVLSGVRILY